ncbi:hypothetical protein Btru_052121 [Bulinus truncatus]|nr:hypothetical protein Btru_052121 [Bulinus truncatus]
MCGLPQKPQRWCICRTVNQPDFQIDNFITFCNGTSGDLIRMDLTSFSYTRVHLPDLLNCSAVVFHPIDEHFYFSKVQDSSNRATIYSLNQKGNHVSQLANAETSGSVNGMAIDLRRSMIFYSDTLNRYIVQQATNNGFTSTYAVNTDQLRSLAVDTNTGEVYYASGGLHPRIEKFKYIGPNTTSVLITNAIVNPFGIAIDYKAKLLYFCDAGTHTIEVMNTDGTNRKVLFTDFSSQLSGLSITSQYIFYTDLNKRHIMRLNRDGSSHTSIGPADFPNLKYIYAHELSFLSQ